MNCDERGQVEKGLNAHNSPLNYKLMGLERGTEAPFARSNILPSYPTPTEGKDKLKVV